MTVDEYANFGMGETEKKYRCRWFNEKDQLTESVFAEHELKVFEVATASQVLRS